MNITYNNKHKLGKKIKKQRLNEKLSLRSLASACEMSYATLNDIENGNGFPTEKVFIRLIEKLNFIDKEKMFDLYADIKDSAPPDVTDYLSKNKAAVELVRAAMKHDKGDSQNETV